MYWNLINSSRTYILEIMTIHNQNYFPNEKKIVCMNVKKILLYKDWYLIIIY